MTILWVKGCGFPIVFRNVWVTVLDDFFLLSFYPDCLSECTYKPLKTKYLPGFGSFMQVFCTTRKYKFCQSRPSQSLFQFFFFFIPILFALIYILPMTGGVWVNTGFILYSTSPFSLTFILSICLYSILFIYIKKKLSAVSPAMQFFSLLPKAPFMFLVFFLLSSKLCYLPYSLIFPWAHILSNSIVT